MANLPSFTLASGVYPCLLLFFLLSLPLSASPSFHSDKSYPAIGLRFRVLASSQPAPVASPRVYTFTFTRGEKQWKEDLYSPAELWLSTQCVGQWRDRDDNVLALGLPSAVPLPEDFGTVASLNGVSQRFASREQFDAAFATASNAFFSASASASAAGFQTWVSAFAGSKASEPVPLRAPFCLTRAFFVPLESTASLAWLFRAKVPGGGESPWFCAVLTIADNTPPAKARKDFELQFLAHVQGLSGSFLSSGGASRPASEKKALITTRQSSSIPDSPSRTAARASIANMKDWWYADTPEYIFLSNIRSSTGKALIRSLQGDLPPLRKAMMELIPPYQDITDVSIVRIFEDQSAYTQYIGENMEWSIGCWVPMRRELVILSQGKKPDETQRVIQHEGFHQYLFYASSMIENALWYNEGHACYFEGAEVDRRGRVTFKETGRQRYLQANLARAVSRIPFVLSADYKAFYGGSDDTRALNYATAWALVWYLRQGIPSGSPYARILPAYRESLLSSRTASTATLDAFKGISLPSFQSAFSSYWSHRR